MIKLRTFSSHLESMLGRGWYPFTALIGRWGFSDVGSAEKPVLVLIRWRGRRLFWLAENRPSDIAADQDSHSWYVVVVEYLRSLSPTSSFLTNQTPISKLKGYHMQDDNKWRFRFSRATITISPTAIY
jgi:hypothetical protein